MKKIAVLYKGIFLKKIVQPAMDEAYFKYAKEIIDNHKEMLYNFIEKDCEINFYFSTYDLCKQVNELYKKEFNPKSYTYIPTNLLVDVETWRAQMIHYKNLLCDLEDSKIEYDFYLFLRPDIRILKKWNELNLDMNKFNIVIEHSSGNCDDNFWVFPKEYLDAFCKSMDNLIFANCYKMTHEINHELIKYDVPIHYMSVHDNSKHGQDIFDICR
jgi:hypothetical protein